MLGHTQDSVLFKHYRALTKKADARVFYELVPDKVKGEDCKSVQMV
jgi:hypothetical protein